jgi:hypothetical protein
MSAAVTRRDRRLREDAFRAQRELNLARWTEVWHWGTENRSESRFYGLIEDLAKRSAADNRATCRGSGIHFEACWPILRSCPGVRVCASTRSSAR